MTKKDYVRIAAAIRTARHDGQAGEVCVDCLVTELVKVFEANNPAFDVDKFEKAVQP